MEIKTVICAVEQAGRFDGEINTLLSAGWKMKRRQILRLPGPPSEAFNTPVVTALYAELERATQRHPEEVTL